MAETDNNLKYNLVHLTGTREYLAPLVASQLFDQAEFQAITREGFAPQKVEVWIIGPMRDYYDKEARKKINELRKRCPHITIKMINGIGRLKSFPIQHLLKKNRTDLNKDIPVVYHCRGEVVSQWALKLRDLFPADRVVLDVRGNRPAEYLYKYGIEDPTSATGAHLVEYQSKFDFLKKIISQVDAVTTVSNALKNLLVQEVSAPSTTAVVPCCVTAITSDEQRNHIRKEWGVNEDEIVVVYSGTTARYQHLEDLTIPFLKELIKQNNKIRLAFFSSEDEKIKQMLLNAGIDIASVIIRNYPQNEVAVALTACDAGILVRKPTLVNRIANPVKIAEYMASGLPIIIEKGIGGVAQMLFEMSLLRGIEIADGNNIHEEVINVNNWLSSDIKTKRQQAREYVKKVYLWSAAVHVSRAMYQRALSR